MTKPIKKPRLVSPGGATLRNIQASSIAERKKPITLPKISMEKKSSA